MFIKCLIESRCHFVLLHFDSFLTTPYRVDPSRRPHLEETQFYRYKNRQFQRDHNSLSSNEFKGKAPSLTEDNTRLEGITANITHWKVKNTRLKLADS